MLALGQTALKQLDRLKHLHLELGISDDRNGSLQYVVAKLMSGKFRHDLVHTELAAPGLVTELPHEDLVVPIVGSLEDLVYLVGSTLSLKALFDHIGGEFQLAESHEVSCDEVEDLVIADLVPQFEHVLHQVVAIGVLNQEVDAADDDIGEGKLLRGKAFLEAALHDAAAVLVRSNLVAVGHACTINESSVDFKRLRSWLVGLLRLVRCLECEQESLNDMIAIGVGRQVEDVLRHQLSDGEDFIVKSCGVGTNRFNEGLNDSGSVQVHGYLNQGGEDGLDKLLEGGNWADFDQLLAKVVSELVDHDIWEDVEHDVNKACGESFNSDFVRDISFELLLDHTAACLVKGEILDFLDDVELILAQQSGQVLG